MIPFPFTVRRLLCEGILYISAFLGVSVLFVAVGSACIGNYCIDVFFSA